MSTKQNKGTEAMISSELKEELIEKYKVEKAAATVTASNRTEVMKARGFKKVIIKSPHPFSDRNVWQSVWVNENNITWNKG